MNKASMQKTELLTPNHDWSSIKQDFTSVLQQEAESLLNLSMQLPDHLELLIEKIINTRGKIIFSGCGKSGIVARKLAATFSSLGIPALFLHPTEALHGDLGIIQKQDSFIALSKSGNIVDLDPVFSFLHNQQIHITLICCASGISIDKVNLVIRLRFNQEACALNLAPTSSSTLMMAFGDALAVTISKMKGFTKNDYARLHPAGTLGKKLLYTVKDLMHTYTNLPLINLETPFKDLLFTISSKKLGAGIVIDIDQKLLGVITDGDLRRACNEGPSVFTKTAGDIMVTKPKITTKNTLAIDALAYMELHAITSLIVLEEERVIGLIHIHDIIKAGLQG